LALDPNYIFALEQRSKAKHSKDILKNSKKKFWKW
jgi:hypothetical protein